MRFYWRTAQPFACLLPTLLSPELRSRDSARGPHAWSARSLVRYGSVRILGHLLYSPAFPRSCCGTNHPPVGGLPQRSICHSHLCQCGQAKALIWAFTGRWGVPCHNRPPAQQRGERAGPHTGSYSFGTDVHDHFCTHFVACGSRRPRDTLERDMFSTSPTIRRPRAFLTGAGMCHTLTEREQGHGCPPRRGSSLGARHQELARDVRKAPAGVSSLL